MVMLYQEVEAERLNQLEATGKWVSMPKIDGDNFQTLCKHIQYANGSDRAVMLINRHENNYTRQFPEIVAGLGVKKGISAVLNGEIAYWNAEKQVYDFNIFRGRQGLQKEKDIVRRRLMFPCKFYVFDLISYNGTDMANNPHYPFSKRYAILQQIINNNNVTELLPVRYDLAQHFKEECEAGREGIMVKNLDNIYINSRTNSILKCKNWHYSDLTFTGFEDNNAGITLTNEQGDRVLVAGKQAEIVRATIIQSGEAICTIRHLQDRTENNRLREPTFKELIC